MYPEHDKIDTTTAETIGEFLEWLRQKGYVICCWNEKLQEMLPAGGHDDDYIHQFFNVNPVELEKERIAILAQYRKQAPGLFKQE